ncbi:MAG: hypothetical protein BIFFINMI_01513 [Phycisphaerae bacterium]|nr:hypothetical protein [Phycisphaerae bacterium]
MSQVICNDSGRVLLHYGEEISRWSQARKMLDVPQPGQRGELWLYLAQYAGNRVPLEVSVNGRAAGRISPSASLGWDWRCVTVGRGLLKRGRNQFVLSTRSDEPCTWILGVEPGGGRASAVSLDGGRTWHADAKGPQRLFAGEYLARLYLPDLPDRRKRVKVIYEDFGHPQLAALRRRLKLGQALRGRRHAMDKVRALMSLVAKLWKVRVKGWTPSGTPAEGTRTVAPWDTLTTRAWMERNNVQHDLQPVAFCVHFGIAMVQCCAAVGLYARPVVMEADDPRCPNGHFCAEVWIPQWKRWVYVDPDHDICYRRGDEYLNLAQVSDASLSGRLDEVTPEFGPSFGYDPRLVPGQEWRFHKFGGYNRWGIYPRTDFFSTPGVHPVHHGHGNYRFAGFIWYDDPRLERRHWFPRYTADLEAIYAPPPGQ